LIAGEKRKSEMKGRSRAGRRSGGDKIWDGRRKKKKKSLKGCGGSKEG
jgi:hypothetical protein